MFFGLFGRKKKLFDLRPVNKNLAIWAGKEITPWQGYARSEAEARISCHEERSGGGMHEFEGNPDDSPWLLKKYSKCKIIEDDEEDNE